MNPDDAASIEACVGGRAEAFQALVERYQREAMGHALAILRHEEDARDAVQEAFLDAFRALKSFDRTRSFYPWFYTLLRARCFKLLAERKRRADALSKVPLLQRKNGEGGGREEDLEAALLEMDAEARELLLLKHVDGLSYAELAARLGVPPGTVMSRLYHARLALKEKLERRGVLKGAAKEAR